jgi:hypothetical protein
MHGHSWFKSREGGRVLAQALIVLGMPEQIRNQIAKFIEKLRRLLQ